MGKKKKTDERITPSGETMREKWYALARRYCAIMVHRQRTKERCKQCFAMRLRKSDRMVMPRFGCGGCVEMDDFYEEAAALIIGEVVNQMYRFVS